MRAASDQRIRLSLRRWIAAWALACVAVAATAAAWADIVRLGLKDEETSYVLVAPIVALWLGCVRRPRLAYLRPGGEWIGLMFIVIGWFLWSYGYTKGATTFWHAGPVLIATGAFIAATGSDVLAKMFPAFVSLLFMVPLTPARRQIIAAPLERYASTWTTAACEFTGLHVLQHGNLLSVNGVTIEVAEACNGMRQVITFWVVSYAVAFSQPLRWYMRVLILAAVPVLAIGSNVVRLVPTVWMYSYGASAVAHTFHDVAGWAMLILALGVLYSFIALLQWALVPVRHFQSVAC